MQLSYITLGETGQVTCHDENGNELFLQLPITPDSQNYINGEPLDMGTAKECQGISDEHFGNGDRTLARLCYAGGKEYESGKIGRKKYRAFREVYDDLVTQEKQTYTDEAAK